MIRFVVFLVLMQVAAVAVATPSYEGRRVGTSVTYADGSVVSIECDAVDQCNLTLEKSSRRWRVNHGDFQGLLVLPSQLSLVGAERDGEFVVETEVACDAYSEGLPAHICLAQFTVRNSKVVRHVVLKRTLEDSRDVVPFVVRPVRGASLCAVLEDQSTYMGQTIRMSVEYVSDTVSYSFVRDQACGPRGMVTGNIDGDTGDGSYTRFMGERQTHCAALGASAVCTVDARIDADIEFKRDPDGVPAAFIRHVYAARIGTD